MRHLFARVSINLLGLLASTLVHAKLNVVTTTTDLAYLVSQLSKGTQSKVESLARGTQDPHFLEAKPSYMVKLSRADLLVAIGLELEVGWLPSIQRGSRNPKVQNGAAGFVEVGSWVEAIEKPLMGNVSRADGDVHPGGNPHVTLDPIRVAIISKKLASVLGSLDPTNGVIYKKNADEFAARLESQTKSWQERLKASGVLRAVTYHKTLNYFFDRFGIENSAILEPKPGIPPTSAHILSVIKVIKEKKVSLVLIENYFDTSPSKKLKAEIPNLNVVSVPVSVEGEKGIASLEDLYEKMVRSFEAAKAKI